jgi:hypothetical protein
MNAVLHAEVIESTDVGMAELRNGTSLALKAFERFRLLGEMLGENLDGDRRSRRLSTAR